MKHFSIVAALALTGCSALIGGEKRTYLCEGGRLVDVSLAAQTARVYWENETFDLRHVPSASGVRYAGERIVLHTKADEALISVDGRELGSCQQAERKN